MTAPSVQVIKVGGSILRDAPSFERVSRLLAARFKRHATWVVVSAAEGVTDSLSQLARDASATEAGSLLQLHAGLAGTDLPPFLETDLHAARLAARWGASDRLLAWGERASVAALHARLTRVGVTAPVVELTVERPPEWRPHALVPGFYVRGWSGEEQCLPRGGSDLSAVWVAGALGCPSVSLWKNGGGIWTDTGSLAEISAPELLTRMAGAIRPVHWAAVWLAHQWGIDLELMDPFGNSASTRVRARDGTTESAAPIHAHRGMPDALGHSPPARDGVTIQTTPCELLPKDGSPPFRDLP